MSKESEIDFIKKVRKLVIISMFSDDYLMEKLVLKGASAMELFYGITQRSSIDVDFSLEECFSEDDLKFVPANIENALQKTFNDEGYTVFDYRFEEVPKENEAPFWGGYFIEFKLIETSKFLALKNELNKMQVRAKQIGKNKSTKFRVDISKFEFCGKKVRENMDKHIIYLYTAEMIALEKIRAICQQMPNYEYRQNTKTPRSKDFFDIYNLCEGLGISLATKENHELLQKIFSIKKVPIVFLDSIETQREYHSQDFVAIKDNVEMS